MRQSPFPYKSLAFWLFRRARLTPDQPSLSYWHSSSHHEQWTFGELDTAARRLAGWLRRQGIDHGDRVAFHDLNDARFVITMFASAYLGAVFVPVNFRLAAAEVLETLADCGAKMVVHGQAFESIKPGLQARVPGAQTLLSDREAPGLFEAILADEEGACREPVDLDWEDTAFLLYTSGSTGKPKGVMLSHGNLFWNSINTLLIQGGMPSDRLLISAPLFHAAPVSSFLEAFLRGATIHLERSFDAQQVLERIVTDGISMVAGVPAMYAMMAAHERFADTDLGRLRAIIVGGSPVPQALIDTFRARGVAVIQRYGLTEAAPLITGLPVNSPPQKAMSAGLPGLFVDMRISTPDAEGIGEIQARGPNIMRGYWGREKETRDAMDGEWLRTGDLGRMDTDGYLSVAGRSKDMIISGGENIYAAEVEAQIVGAPGVLEAAVIGVPHVKWGETVWAMVTPRSGALLTSEHILEHLQGRLARYKQPSRVIVLDELPKNGAGKVDKLALQQRYRSEALGATR